MSSELVVDGAYVGLVGGACVGAAVAVLGVLPVLTENQRGPAQRYVRAVAEPDPPDRLAVHEGAVGRAQVDEDNLAILHPQLGMVPRHARINQAQVAVRAPAEQRHRALQLVGVLAAVARGRAGGAGPGDQQPWMAGETRPRRPRQVTGGQPDLAALDGRAADHAGPDPERARGHVRDALEAHPYRAHERVALLLGVVPGQVGQFDAQALGVHVQAVVVGLGQLDDEIVGHQGPALGHDGGPVVHFPLDRAGHLDRLQLGPEGAREGTLNHAFQATLEALQDSQRATSLPVLAPDRIRGTGALAVVLTYFLPPGGWRNGRRARFRSVCPKGREGSNPSSPTYIYLYYPAPLGLTAALGSFRAR